MPAWKFTKKTYSYILFHVFCPYFLRMHYDYFFWRGFESVQAQFLSAESSILPIYLFNLDSSNSLCWIWHLTFSWVQFLSNQLDSFVSCNIKLFALCFDMYFFIKTYLFSIMVIINFYSDISTKFTLSKIISTRKEWWYLTRCVLTSLW